MDRLIIDSDFIIAYLSENDSNHKKTVRYLQNNQNNNFVVINLVKYEIATVLSRLFSQSKAVELFNLINWSEMEEIFIDQPLFEKAFLIYSTQSKKNISITDCSNLALAETLKLNIASFDKFYPAALRINLN